MSTSPSSGKKRGAAGRPRKKYKKDDNDAEACAWVVEQMRSFLESKRSVCKGNPDKDLQQMTDAITCVVLHKNSPPPGMVSSFLRMTGFTRSMIDRAEQLREQKTITPEQIKKPSSYFSLVRHPQTSGPKKKRDMMWIYLWFHDQEKNPMVFPDKTRPEQMKGVRAKILINGNWLKVTCCRMFMTGFKQDMTDCFLHCAEYKKWQKDNNGDTLSRGFVQKCICPCMKPAQVNECACRICTEMEAALRAWHTQRVTWHKATKCSCPGCSDPTKFQRYFGASKSLRDFRGACLCPKISFPELRIPHLPDTVPAFRDLKCCTYSDKYPVHVKNPCTKCGVHQRLYSHNSCIERDAQQKASWMQWIDTEVDASEKNGGTKRRMVYREVHGTRKRLLERVFMLARTYFYHHWVHAATFHLGRLRNVTYVLAC